MGLSEIEDLRQRYSHLKELYSDAVKERDQAIEERNKATVLIALQLQSETEELNKRIETLQIQNRKLDEENEDLKIRLGYAKADLNKLQQTHIKLQIEQERCLQEKEDALAQVKEFENFRNKSQIVEVIDNQGEAKMTSEQEDPAYSNVRDEIFTSGADENLELEPKPPVTLKKSSLDDVYNVHEEIGKGKFGVVKRVTERSSKTTFAAKHIRLSTAGSGSSRDDIVREIDIMNKLHHKRLVGLIDAFETSRNIVMIMEFVSGGELFERVADADCLTEREASFYMYQLLQGLQYMHTKNIVHLDLKPENIVCVSKNSWDIKLIDFGLAQELVPGVTMTALKGTPEFMAPEAVNFEPISLATDMWSVGVIAYILLSGLSPLLGEDNNETLANVTAVEWDFEDESFDVISDEAKDFISQLMVKSPRKRNTVTQSLEHEWMKKSASTNAIKIDTKKLKQFLAKRRWQIPFLSECANHPKMLTEDEILEKSVNALKAVRRLSTLSSLMNLKSRPSIAPSLPTLPSAKEDVEDATGSNEIRKGKDENDAGETTNVENVLKEEDDEEKPKEPPVFSKELSNLSITEGETASFEVVIENDTNCQIHWFKHGVEVIENQRLKVERHDDGRHLLLIEDIADDDCGEYSCVAKNEAGKAISTGTISIQRSSLSKSDETDEEDEEIDNSIEVPVFKKELHDITASEHDNVTLEVIVSGDSPYELEWFKNAVDITENDRVSVVKHEDGRFTLNIRECEDDDTGEYCCVAQNEAGRVTCAGWLTVEVESVLSEDDEETESESEDEFVPKDFVAIREGDVQKFYCIEEEVGRGRFGIVKKCVELDTATRFCAKLIKSRPSQKEEFKREIDVMNTLHHPRIIRLYDAFEEPRQIILILEYCRGGDLFNRIDGDSLPEFEAVKILKQVLEAVKYMHDLGFMHLDLKPQNVMFKNEGGLKIKLIDFSLTKKFDPEQETKISFGTAEYVAPEIVNYEPVTLAADMWAIGVIAYIMLSGESPFLCESEADTFSRITDARWEFTDVFDYVSKEAKDFITRLLLKDPKKRMKVDECLEHEWIKSPGFTGKRKSKNSSEGEMTIDQNSNVTSPTELMRQESRKSELELPLDPRKLESKVKSLLSKLQNAEKENQELEEKLRDVEDRADALEDDLHTSQSSRRVLEDRVSKLEAEKTDLSKKAKTNSDVLKRVAQSEGDKRALEDKLSEQTQYLENLSQKYDSLKEKIENYDILEEKVYLLERERKDLRDTKQSLEDKIAHLQVEKEELTKMNEKNSLINRDLDNEITKLKAHRDEIENQYVCLQTEKESLVEELTKRFNILDEQKKSLSQDKSNLETKLSAFEIENKNLRLKLDDLTKDIESLKEVSKQNEQGKEKEELEKELTKVKIQKDEAKETCEELTSKLSKAYAELEQLKPAKMGLVTENRQEDISALKEKLSSLEEERDNLEDDLDDREAEIVELKGKIEHLEAENKDRNKDIMNYKSQLEVANEEIKSWKTRKDGTSSATPKEDQGNLNEKIKDYESMMSKLTKEISSLQGKLSAAEQLNKTLEEKVKSSTQESFLDPNMEGEIIGRSENTLEYASMDFDCFDTADHSPREDRNGRDERISPQGRINNVLNREEKSEKFVLLKKEFEKVRRISEDAETRLAEELKKNQILEDEIEDFEIREEKGLRLYRELKEECNRLRAQLNDSESPKNQVEARLREKLKSNEEETEALCKQLDSLKKELQVIKEEREKGDTLYTNLSERYRNLSKEKKILEQEKHERDESETKSRELEDSLQTRILELTNMKDEIESMRDKLRSLVREKEEGIKEFSMLQKDLVKATNDRRQLEKQVKDEIFRAEKMERDRFILQGKIEEMQKSLHKQDLVAAVDKKAIDAYVDEIRLLKDEKGNAVKEVDRLRKHSKNLMHDLEKISKEREDVETLKIFKEQAIKEIKTLKDENQRLNQKSEDVDRITADLNTLREEKAIGLQHLGILEEESEIASREIAALKSENELLLEKANQLEELKEAFEALKDDAESLRETIEALKLERKATKKEIEDLRNTNNLHLEKIVEYDRMQEDLETLKEEKVMGLKELSSLREENAALLEEVKATDELKRECDLIKSEKERAFEENRILIKRNESLVKEQESDQRITLAFKAAEDEAERISKENGVLAEKCQTLMSKIKELTLLNDSHLMELSRLNHDLGESRKEKEALSAELESFHVIKKDLNASLESNRRLNKESRDLEVNLETQALETMRLKKEINVLKKKNDALTTEIERLQGQNAIIENQTSIALWKDGEESEQIYEPKPSNATDVRRKLDEFTTFEEIAGKYNVEEEKPGNVNFTKCNKRNETEALKQEVDFLQKEVEDLSEDHKELLQSYNALQKEYDHSKDKFGIIEKSLEIKSREMKSMTEVRDLLENTKIELENELKVTSQEKVQVSRELETLKEKFDSQCRSLENAEKEIGNLFKENEELHQNHIELEERYGRIRKLNRELEEDIDIETGKLVEAKERISELKKENSHLQQMNLNLQHEIDKLKGVPELSGQEQGGVAKKVKHLEKKISVAQLQKGDFETRSHGEKNKAQNATEKNMVKVLGDETRKPQGWTENVRENKSQQNQGERTVWTLEQEIKSLRPNKERAEALAKELDQVKQRLDNEIKIRESKTEESSQKKKENDSLIYELESTRHRIVSNVINPLEEAKLPWKFRVTAADISAGKSKAWSSIKESIGTLIWDRERLVNDNKVLKQENTELKRECQEPMKGKEKIKKFEELVGNHPTDEDILSKKQEIKAIHETIASDKDKLTQLQQQKEDLLLKIEFMKRMQSTAGQEKDQLVAGKSLFTSDGRLGPNSHSRFKFRRFQSVESISILKERDTFEEKQDPVDFPTQTLTVKTQWTGNERSEISTGEEQLQVARQLVKKNRRIFELEQEVDVLLTKIEESSPGNAAVESFSSDVENFKAEILRLEGENKRLKELANEPILASSQKKMESLEAMNNFLKSEKEELILEISAKNKKIELLEKRVRELTEMRSNVVNGSRNGIHDEADLQINALDEELSKTKHRVCELEAELEHLSNSHKSKLKRELDEVEAKWTKRLRKECMELQSELSEKHSKEKQLWQKKEVELQNIIRQMKIVMDKRLSQAETERRKLEQELNTVKTSGFHGSTISLDSNSDDSAGGVSPDPGKGKDATQSDGLSDRELRRVAYKLNGEEWSRLGTFLGVGDRDLGQLGGLSMGPQEKAFKLLVMWRTRCRLSRAQMISHLAVALEEVNRKDVAQFVLEQFMSGKPRKKLFGW